MGLGATMPLGYFDPLGFCKVGDEEGFRKLRIAELKHGRVAMMAAVGAVWQPVFPFPGFEKVPAGIGAVLSPQGMNGFAALVLLSGALELVFWKDDSSKSVDSIGDYGNPFQLGIGTPWVRMRTCGTGSSTTAAPPCLRLWASLWLSWPPARMPWSSSASRRTCCCAKACIFQGLAAPPSPHTARGERRR